ncbi:complement C1q-like protein 4 [Argopecten irradians]|uniref:complement C1q-like protein 4 n=1 Tax=Argopecten irradians TaxID=31199 RepID=UPI0037245352
MDTPNSVDNTDLRTSVDQPSGNSSIADHISDDVKPLSNANAESVPFSQIDGITRTNVQPSDNVNADDNKSNLRHSRVSPIHGLNQVAFQAMLNHQIGSLGDDETIRFDRMQVNLGGGYNPTSGVFTCSVPGLYVFHVTAVNYSGKSFELHFMKNGQEFGRLYLGDEDNTRSDSASSTFIVELQVSDSVRIASNTNHDSGQVILPAYSFFNAFLLYPNSL